MAIWGSPSPPLLQCVTRASFSVRQEEQPPPHAPHRAAVSIQCVRKTVGRGAAAGTNQLPLRATTQLNLELGGEQRKSQAKEQTRQEPLIWRSKPMVPDHLEADGDRRGLQGAVGVLGP